MPTKFHFRLGKVQQGTPATIRARVAADTASGTWTGVDGEGNWIRQTDLSGITCQVFDLDSATPTTPIAAPAIDKTAAILNTPDTSRINWNADNVGFNFIVPLAGTCFPTANHRIKIVFTFTLASNGESFAVSAEATAEAI